MDTNLRRSRHSVTEWASLARCERLYSWDALGRAPYEARVSALLACDDDRDSTASKLGTDVHSALATGRYEDVKRLGFPQLAEWAAARSSDEVWPELNFELTIQGEVLVGAMDRVERSGDGFALIDFKILQSQKTDGELRNTYRMPLELYAYALGQLEPAARDRTRAVLVCATQDSSENPGKSLREVEIPLPKYPELEASVLQQRQRAVGVVTEDVPAKAQPGLHCRTCRYRPHCVEGRAPLH